MRRETAPKFAEHDRMHVESVDAYEHERARNAHYRAENDHENAEHKRRHTENVQEIAYLRRVSLGHYDVRSRCVEDFNLNRLGCPKTADRRRVIQRGGVAAHEGGPVVDALLYLEGEHKDENVYEIIYGLTFREVLNYSESNRHPFSQFSFRTPLICSFSKRHRRVLYICHRCPALFWNSTVPMTSSR